ncbi:hypothetical protein Ddc_14897 [Ditylenchus destructor]|nr:hypothetical protein Ddc_14897 [Ditylenchus destructor]
MFPRTKYSALILVGILLSLVVLIHAKGRTSRRGGGNARPDPPERPKPKTAAPATASRCPIKKCTKPVNCQNLVPQGRLKCNKCNIRKRVKRAGEQTGPGNCGPARAGPPPGGNNVQPGGNNAQPGGNNWHSGDQPPGPYDPGWWAPEIWHPDGFEPYNEATDRNNPRSIWYRGARGTAVLKVCLKGYCTNDLQCQHMATERGMPHRACGTCKMKKDKGYGTCAHGRASDRGFKYDGRFADPHQYGPTDENMRKCPSMYCRTTVECDKAADKLKVEGNKRCGQCWWPISPRCGQEPAKEDLWKANAMANQLWDAPEVKALVTKKCDFKRNCTTHQECSRRAVAAGLGFDGCGLCHEHVGRCMLSPTYRVAAQYQRNPALQPHSPPDSPQAGGSDSILESIWENSEDNEKAMAKRMRPEARPKNPREALEEIIQEEREKQTSRCGEVINCHRLSDDQVCDEFAKRVLGFRNSRHACGYCDRSDGRCKWNHGGHHGSDGEAGSNIYFDELPKFIPNPLNPAHLHRLHEPFWLNTGGGGVFDPAKSLRPRSRPINMAKCNTIWCNGDHNKCINGAEGFGLQKGQCGRWCSPTTNRCERAIGSPVH